MLSIFPHPSSLLDAIERAATPIRISPGSLRPALPQSASPARPVAPSPLPPAPPSAPSAPVLSSGPGVILAGNLPALLAQAASAPGTPDGAPRPGPAAHAADAHGASALPTPAPATPVSAAPVPATTAAAQPNPAAPATPLVADIPLPDRAPLPPMVAGPAAPHPRNIGPAADISGRIPHPAPDAEKPSEGLSAWFLMSPAWGPIWKSAARIVGATLAIVFVLEVVAGV